MKKIISIFSAIIMCIACLGVFSFKRTHNVAQGEEETFLISPTALAVSSTSIYVADSATGKILSYNKNTKTITASVSLLNVKKLLISGENLFALTISGDTHVGIHQINLSLNSAPTALTFSSSSYKVNEIVDIAVSDSTICALRNNGDIDTFTLADGTLTYQAMSTIVTKNLGIEEFSLKSINTKSNSFIIASSSLVFDLNRETGDLTTIYSSPNETITLAMASHIITSNGKLVDLESKATTTTYISSCTGISVSDDIIYLSSAFTHKVFKVEGGKLEDLNLNPAISPTTLTANKLIHIKLLESTPLYLEPFSVSPCTTLDSNTHLTVIGTHEDFYYCMVVGTVNQYLYLNKSTTNFETINIGSSNTKFTATRTNKIYSLPSTVLDEKNLNLGSIQASEDIVVKNSTIIENSNGELFYLVEHDGGYGFVRTSFFQSTKGTIELTTPCNAKTKRTTTLFENADATGVILTLEKGTRIALKEDASPTKDYCLVEYQDSSGVVFTGYVLSDDIDPDGLSTLQILGLILVGTNLTLLLTILMIKKRSKKWKI